MDIVHHALIGGAGYAAAAQLDAPLTGAAFVAASIFPDLDVLLIAFGRRFYLRHHQGISHSLPLSPLYALLIAAPLWGLMPEAVGNDGPLLTALAALAGLWLHIALDLLNTFRIALFAPFSSRRYSLDAVFFIDAPALALTAGFYLGYYGLGYGPALWMYPLLLALYLLYRLSLRRNIQRHLQPRIAIPSSLNPFAFFVLDADPGESAVSVLYNAFSGRHSQRRDYPAIAPSYEALAASSPVYRDMLRIGRAMRIVEVREDETGLSLYAEDVALRNFGGRFGRTQLRFDNQGRLTGEVANI